VKGKKPKSIKDGIEEVEAIVLNDDIFAKALAQTANVIERTMTFTEKTLDTNIVPASKVKTWEEMRSAMDNEHAEKFNKILTQLPDREFMRIYLKAMEFFKPKVIRTAGERGEKVDKTINIQINLGDKK